MTTYFPALLGAITASLIVACFVALYAIRARREWTPPGLLKAIEYELNILVGQQNLADRFQAAESLNGNGKWTEPWYEDEGSNSDICPACGQVRANRVSGKPGWFSGSIYSDPGAGKEHDDGLSWFHYISRDNIPAWEALGWKVKEIGPPHDSYSILGEWTGEGPPRKP